MLLAWDGSIATTIGAVRLLQLLDNILLWAIRIHKPRLSSHLDRWRTLFIEKDELHKLEDEQLERVVQAVKGRFTRLGLVVNQDVMRLAITMQEVMAASATPNAAPDPAPPPTMTVASASPAVFVSAASAPIRKVATVLKSQSRADIWRGIGSSLLSPPFVPVTPPARAPAFTFGTKPGAGDGAPFDFTPTVCTPATSLPIRSTTRNDQVLSSSHSTPTGVIQRQFNKAPQQVFTETKAVGHVFGKVFGHTLGQGHQEEDTTASISATGTDITTAAAVPLTVEVLESVRRSSPKEEFEAVDTAPLSATSTNIPPELRLGNRGYRAGSFVTVDSSFDDGDKSYVGSICNEGRRGAGREREDGDDGRDEDGHDEDKRRAEEGYQDQNNRRRKSCRIQRSDIEERKKTTEVDAKEADNEVQKTHSASGSGVFQSKGRVNEKLPERQKSHGGLSVSEEEEEVKEEKDDEDDEDDDNDYEDETDDEDEEVNERGEEEEEEEEEEETSQENE